MRSARTFWLTAFILLGLSSHWSVAQGAEVLRLLNEPGTHAIMRHALAPGTGDPDNFRLRDCATQRNLDQAGRAQAMAIGSAFRAAGVEFDRVFSSQWCRCLETAKILGLGDVEELPALNSFFEDRSTAESQTRSALRFLHGLGENENVLLVTHQVNITALTGQFPSSGEVLLIRTDDAGMLNVVGRYLVEP